MNSRTDDRPGTMQRIGPVLFARGGDGTANRYAVLVIRPQGEAFPTITDPSGALCPGMIIDRRFGMEARVFELSLPAGRMSSYRFGEKEFTVAAPDAREARYAYVSCNGQEYGDLDRPAEIRDAMWGRLAEEHERRRVSLLLHGGDQLYADEVLQCHPEVDAWWKASTEASARMELTDEIRAAVRRFYFDHYCRIYARPAFLRLCGEAASVMMWDDHDIFDGWGSHDTRRLDSPIGRCLFEEARSCFLLFQLAARDGELPDTVMERAGRSLGQAIRYPGFSVLALDLRSERRPDRVMDESGWSGLEDAVRQTPKDHRMLVMSSVPVLGPPLSWIEAVSDFVPRLRRYEDDMRDQWQSRAHRQEWFRFVELIAGWRASGAGALTILSGEIHLATRAELAFEDGGVVHQLVSSGIAHEPPSRAYPALLGILVRFAQTPEKNSVVTAKPLPGTSSLYRAERNWMMLERRDGIWTASWNLEASGQTEPLTI